MDRADAIEILERYRVFAGGVYHDAIEALQEPKGDYEFFGGEYAKEGDAESATTTHGRLIDADALLKPIEESWKHAGLHAEDYKKIKKWIKNAPSVLPDFETFCGVPIKEAIEVLEKYKHSPSVTPTERTGEWVEKRRVAITTSPGSMVLLSMILDLSTIPVE